MAIPEPSAVHARVVGGRLTAAKWPVADGGIADIAVVVACDEHRQPGLFLADLSRVRRRDLTTLDPTRNHARLDFDATPVQSMGSAAGASVQRVSGSAAILFAFEQVGGADACLQMARDYAQERFAFGRPIGSFQAIKHKLADMYVALELARSNAYYGAWALGADATDLAWPRLRSAFPPPRRSILPRRKISRRTAGLASPGRSTAICSIGVRNNLVLRSGPRRSGKTGWSTCWKHATPPERGVGDGLQRHCRRSCVQSRGSGVSECERGTQGWDEAGAATKRGRCGSGSALQGVAGEEG